MFSRELQPLFWDTNPNRLDLEADAFYIIERLLEWGNEDAIHWLLGQYRTEKIKEVVRLSRQLSRKTATYWSFILHIPIEECRCLNSAYPNRADAV